MPASNLADRQTTARLLHQAPPCYPQDFVRAALDAQPAPVAILDAAGSIITVNRAWCTGGFARPALIPADAVGMNYADICEQATGAAAQDGAAFAAGIRAALAGECAAYAQEYLCRRSQGERWFVGRVTRFHDGGTVYAIVVHEDVTARKTSESVLQQANQNLRAVLEAKTRMIANVSHELRTPLTQISGFAELLVEGVVDGDLSDEQRRCLGVILDRSRALAGLVNTFLTLQNLSAERLERRPCDVEMLVTDTALAWLERAKAARVQLQVDIPPGLPLLDADYDRLRQMLDQVLSNALKFTGEGGTVSIQARRGGEEVRLSVADTGIGIPPDRLGSVFEPFYQVDDSMTRPFGGAGLGLTLAREIVALHHGRIWVESAGAGRGATVHIALPRR